MSRIARLAVSGLPHHVSQSGNGRQPLGDLPDLLADAPPERPLSPIRAQASIGRPPGTPELIETMERKTQRTLLPSKREPKRFPTGAAIC